MRDKRGHLPAPVGYVRSSLRSRFDLLRLGELPLKYLNSFYDPFALGVFSTASVALLTHKALIIWIHRPLPTFKLLLLSPFLFAFDFVSLLALSSGFLSPNRLVRAIASFASLFVSLCSAGFASYYWTVNAEINWGRSIKMITQWKFYGQFLLQGNDHFLKVLMFYIVMGLAAALAKVRFGGGKEKRYKKKQETDEPRKSRSVIKITIALCIGTIFLPRQPWRHLTSTLLWDISTSLINVQIPTSAAIPRNINGTTESKSPGYTPSQDPYYISNLGQPLDPFIASALESTEFKHIFHIVLESMRSDSFPYQEDGLLDQHIRKHFIPVSPITTEAITPFIASLTDRTLRWDTMYASIPYTLKSKLGYLCGMLPIGMDWFIENFEPAKLYQYCLPHVFQQLNAVTNTSPELLSVFNGSVPEATDKWETTYLQSPTGTYGNDVKFMQEAGFNNVLFAEELTSLNGHEEWPYPFGLYDEDSLEYLWKYVDYAQSRTPKSRMYLSWMSSTSHYPFTLPPQWKNNRTYIHDEDAWASINGWLNSVRWTDDTIRDLILGFRERGLEDDTLFVIHGDHAWPFVSPGQSTVDNPHNDGYRIPMLLYNPRIKNPQKRAISGSFYALSIPTTILDLLAHTKSLTQQIQQTLAMTYAANYEHAQSLLRQIRPTIRLFQVAPGNTQWVLDNGSNLRCKFNMEDTHVRLVDYVKDPLEVDVMESWQGVEGLIKDGAEDKFGDGTALFLREAYEQQEYLKVEIPRRYGLGL